MCVRFVRFDIVLTSSCCCSPLASINTCQKTAKELDESVLNLSVDGLLDDLDVKPQSEREMCNTEAESDKMKSLQADILRL